MRRNSTCGETAWNTIQRSHINDIPKGDSNTFFSNFDSIKCYQPHTQHIISKKNNQTRKMWSQKSPRDACGTCTLGGTCWNPHPGSFSKLDFLPTGDRCWKKKITHAESFLSFCWSCFTPKRPGKLWVEKKNTNGGFNTEGSYSSEILVKHQMYLYQHVWRVEMLRKEIDLKIQIKFIQLSKLLVCLS